MASDPPTLREPLPRPAPLPRRESLLPPRAWPSASSGAFFAAAAASAQAVDEPIPRTLLILACGVGAWLVGYFTPPPRRHFRREDRQ